MVANGTLAASGRSLEGYAAVFGEETSINNFQEIVMPGAFTASLGRNDILALVDHDTSKVLGRTRSGTLQLSEDVKGLKFSIAMPNTTLANDTLEMVKRGDIGGCSFAFSIPAGGENWQGKRRELRAVNLLEISIVSAWPAYKGTSVQARSITPRLAAALRYLETT